MHKREIPIYMPCQERWEEMPGDDRRRHCQACEQDVYDLSAMTRREAEPVLARRRNGERVCVRYAADKSGEIRFRSEPLVPAAMLLSVRRLALGAGLLGAALGGCMGGPVTGAAAARAASGEAAERLGASGTCEVSLEPVLPVSLRLHAAACPEHDPARPTDATAPGPTAPAPPPAEPAPSVVSAEEDRPQARRPVPKKPPKPRPTQKEDYLMGFK